MKNKIKNKLMKSYIWKAYSVREGKLLDPCKLDKVTPPALTVINAAASGRSGSNFQLITPRHGRLQTDNSESEEEEDAGIESPSAESQTPALFSCPEESCVRVYMVVSCESEAKKILVRVFSKVSFRTYLFACRNVHTLKYIGVKLPPHSTKFAPTVDR